MARELKDIQKIMFKAKANETALTDLNSSSKVSVWRLLIFIVAFCVRTLELIFDVHRNDVEDRLLKLIPHTARWYRNKALAFQYKFDLLTDSDKYDNKGKTAAQIAASKIIKYSAVTEATEESRLIIKIATEKGDVLMPVDDEQLASFRAYISEIKDAGVNITIINYLPDLLKMKIRIVRDALVLDSKGMNGEAKYPVNDAIKQFMKELPFNGELSIQKLEERILAVKGVNDLSIDLAETSWIDAKKKDYGDWQAIDISKIPVSGYFAVNLTDDNATKSIIKYV